MFISKRSAWGLDVSDRSVELVQVQKKPKGYKIVRYGRATFKEGLIVNGEIIDEKAVAKVLQRLFANLKPDAVRPDFVYLVLQEVNTYFLKIFVANEDKQEAQSIINQKISKEVLLDKEDIVYKALPRKIDGGIEYLVVATSRKLLLSWSKLLRSLGIKKVVFDPEIFSNFRGIFQEQQNKPIMLVDIGSRSTSVGIFDSNGLVYSFVVYKAGNFITKSISNSLKISFEEAEKIKLDIDLYSKKKKDQKTILTIKNNLNTLIKELKEAILYFKKTYNQDISSIYLLGGGSALKGLDKYLQENLSIPISLASKYLTKSKHSVQRPSKFKLYLFYGAIGAAIRGLDKKWHLTNPLITPNDQTINNQKKVSTKKKKLISSSSSKKQVDVQYKQKKLLQLVVVLFVGVLAIIGVYFFKKISKKDSRLIIDNNFQIPEFIYPAEFTKSIPIAVISSEYTADRVRGRIVKKTVSSQEEYLDALVAYPQSLKSILPDEEVFWPLPLNKVMDVSSIEYPTSIDWLVFSDIDAKKIIIDLVKKEFPDEAKFTLDNLDYIDVKQSENENIYLLEVKVKVTANQLPLSLIPEHLPSSLDENNNSRDFVTIKSNLNTDIFLRALPNEQADKVVDLEVGEAYELLEAKDDWVHLKFNDQLDGWILSDYIEK